MRTIIIWICTILALVITQPPIPVWAGAALILTAVSGLKADLSSPSPRKRWAAFKRIAFMFLMGMILILAGKQIGEAPWHLQIESAAQARYAMFSLAVYCISLFGVPAIIWAYISQRHHSRRMPIHCVRNSNTLVDIADNSRRTHVRIAV